MAPKHYPVMLAESLEYLALKPGGRYIDMTAGLGGHTTEIAKRLTNGGTLISNDRDAQSLEMAKRTSAEWAERIEYRHSSFTELAQNPPVDLDGVLADLGVSRFQLTDTERGFSFMTDGPLDMRMDQTKGVTAGELVNNNPEKMIADWIFQYGEERRARKIAGAIVRARPIRSTLHLAGVVGSAVPRTGPMNPATKTFMALRIAVNGEREELDALLDAAPKMVKPGGRIVIISFMSLEDGRVKNSFRELSKNGLAVILTKKPLEPSSKEVQENPPSRSAKLRAVEMALPSENPGKRMGGTYDGKPHKPKKIKHQKVIETGNEEQSHGHTAGIF